MVLKTHDPDCINLVFVARLCYCACASLSPGQLAPVLVLQSSSLKGEVDRCQRESGQSQTDHSAEYVNGGMVKEGTERGQGRKMNQCLEFA